MENKKKTGGCCSCEADFEKKVRNLEKDGQRPTKVQHDKKQGELNSAFKGEKKK